MDDFIGQRLVWLSRDEKVPADVYRNGSDKYYILEGPSGMKEEVTYNKKRGRWETCPFEAGNEEPYDDPRISATQAAMRANRFDPNTGYRV